MRVAISGSRGPDPSRGRPLGWTEFGFVEVLMKGLLAAGDTIHVGDAPSGVDRHVLEIFECAEWAEAYPSDRLKKYDARWEIEGKRAGHNRNDWMVSESDFLIALYGPGPNTPGTTNAIECAIRRGVPFMVAKQGEGWR